MEKLRDTYILNICNQTIIALTQKVTTLVLLPVQFSV